MRTRTNTKEDTYLRDNPPSVCDMLLDRNPAGALTPALHDSLMQHTLQFLVPNTDSSAVAMCAAIFQLAQSPDIVEKLRRELEVVEYDRGDWSRLTQLPYLVG